MSNTAAERLRVCDLVMKGGVTSGVVYPPAIDELRQRFAFSGIGGASAGAIAAALTAAAEYRRRHGSDAGFQSLRDLPGEISGEGRMLQLFRPDRSTRGLFSVFLRALRQKQHPTWIGKMRMYADAGRLVFFQRGLQPFVENGHGLCTGMGIDNPPPRGELPSLTEWLSRRIDDIAGMSGRPLTFGDLAKAPAPAGFESAPPGSIPIRLRLIGTCLTFGRPFAFPQLDNRFAFHPDELRRYLPGYVMDYLVEQGKRINERLETPLTGGLLPLPTGDRMPVILAVRISLSFPVLFSLVPLYYVNHHAGGSPERVYFADGGITSNLPIYFFDSPFPRWPTLAINLQYATKKGEYGRKGVPPTVWMAPNNSAGTLELFTRFLRGTSPIGDVLGLAGVIFRSAQVWTDNSFLVLPGYRDRIVEVWLEPEEGGMNLEMPTDVIERLVARGREAGQRLVERFADAPPTEAMSWDGHRSVRFRAWAEAFATHVHSWRRAVDHPLSGDRTLWDLLGSVDAMPSTRFRSSGSESAEDRRREAEAALRDLRALIERWDQSPVCHEVDDAPARPFCDGPRPKVKLQLRAELE
jgi:predicted acylesterase/phospholipase RssA